jgi:hypothetical protein
LGNAEPGVDTRPAAYRQEIAFLIAAKAENQAKKDLLEKKLDPKAADLDPNIRVGLAEGHARNGDFDLAHKFATAAAAPLDRLDACLGVAFIALNDPKNKAEADKFLTEALAVLAKEKTSVNWQQLQAVKLAARLDKADSVKDLMARMEPPFKLRAQYEIFLAKCERGNPPATAEDLAAIEAEDPEGTTLGLAWLALTRENGATRSQNRKTFEGRGATLQKNVTSELVRPMVDVGTYLQSKK